MATAKPIFPMAPPPGPPAVVPVDRASAKPLYRQLYDGYREAIVERRLKAGDRLPSTRSLAVELGVSRIPVLNAFEQLLAEGYFESRVGSGTFVAQSLPDVAVRPHGRAAPGLSSGASRARVIGRRADELARDTPGRWFGGP